MLLRLTVFYKIKRPIEILKIGTPQIQATFQPILNALQSWSIGN